MPFTRVTSHPQSVWGLTTWGAVPGRFEYNACCEIAKKTMSDGSERVHSTNDAPTISADFLTGSAEIGIDRIRTRLLDLTNRNKLLPGQRGVGWW